MQQTAVARPFNERTGDIVLRGVGNKRLSQALAAGLITDVLRGDVEAVQSENNGLKTALGEAKQEAQREARKASALRREKLNGYLREQEVQEDRRTLREIAYGFCGLGIAVGASIVFMVAAFLL